MIEAAKTANIHHYIRTLSHGYDTMINEEGNNISQGEKQLLTIARAILKDPQILILDEATSSVDTRLEKMLQEAMTRVMQNRTVSYTHLDDHVPISESKGIRSDPVTVGRDRRSAGR